MNLLVSVLLLAGVASARHVVPENNIPYGYLVNVGVPAAEKQRELEKKYAGTEGRIFHGPAAKVGEFPWQAGLIGTLPNGQTNLAGGSLITSNRILTAAHNAGSGQFSVSFFTIVLGSLTVFYGGARIPSTKTVLHHQYNPLVANVNDIAMLHMAYSVGFSATIAPIALPTGAELSQNFAGFWGVTSGFGMTENGVTTNQYLRRLDVNIISNAQCQQTYTSGLLNTHLCVTSAPGSSICTGDSGGPLVVYNNNRWVLVGVTSFGAGCGGNTADGFTRVTSFMDFVWQNM